MYEKPKLKKIVPLKNKIFMFQRLIVGKVIKTLRVTEVLRRFSFVKKLSSKNFHYTFNDKMGSCVLYLSFEMDFRSSILYI